MLQPCARLCDMWHPCTLLSVVVIDQIHEHTVCESCARVAPPTFACTWSCCKAVPSPVRTASVLGKQTLSASAASAPPRQRQHLAAQQHDGAATHMSRATSERRCVKCTAGADTPLLPWWARPCCRCRRCRRCRSTRHQTSQTHRAASEPDILDEQTPVCLSSPTPTPSRSPSKPAAQLRCPEARPPRC